MSPEQANQDVDGVTVARLADAVRAGDIPRVHAVLEARPDLVHMDMASNNEHRALHCAVLARAPEMVQLLMARGADARQGIYPHRDATTAFTIASDRGYAEIVAIIEAEEQRRREPTAAGPALAPRLESADGPLTTAVKRNQPDVLKQLLDRGLDPNEPTRVPGLEEAEFSSGMPLWHCAATGNLAMAETLLKGGANPNAEVYASGTPVSAAYGHGQREKTMIDLLQRHGGVVTPAMAGLYRETELARRMLSDVVDARVNDDQHAGESLAEQMLWGAACGGDPEIVRMALDRVDWTRADPRWYRMLEQPVRIWNHGPWPWAHEDWDRGTYVTCFRLVLQRCDPNVRGRFGLTMLHDVAASREYVTADERVAFATLLLDAGVRLDVRDDLLMSTPLGWACRWGRVELVKLLLARGADPIEADAEPWATPRAWAQKKNREAILAGVI
jgi:ankyrin repeat protein